MQEEITRGLVGGTEALVLVPDDDGPAWSKLLRHGQTVGRLGAGEAGLEMNVLGSWRTCPVRRPARFVLFPRAAGARVQRLALSQRQGMEVVTRTTPGGQRRQKMSMHAGAFEMRITCLNTISLNAAMRECL